MIVNNLYASCLLTDVGNDRFGEERAISSEGEGNTVVKGKTTLY